jgi:hypothetical protein
VGLWRYLRGTDLLEDRSTQPDGEARSIAAPENELPLYGGYTASTITPIGALAIADVWAAVRVLADAASSLPLHVYRKTDSGRERVTSGKLVELLSRTARCRATRLRARARAGAGALRGGRMGLVNRGGIMVPDPDAEVGVEPAIAAHEARHAAAAMLRGLDVLEARADNPSPDASGHVLLGPRCYGRPREDAIMTLAGRWGDPGWPPERPSKVGRTVDEQQLAEAVEAMGLGPRGYELVLADTQHLVGAREFKELVGVLELPLARGCVLRKPHLEQIHRVCGQAELQHKSIEATARVSTDSGEFSAIAAAYSIDTQAT